MASTHEAFRATKFFSSLDGIRCACIVAVIWHHTIDFDAPALWSALPLAQHGFLGVDMFFVISGFLIVTLLLRERDIYGNVSLRQFYARRALRIFPIYYGLLLVLAVAYGIRGTSGESAQQFFADLPFLLTYTSNWVPIHGMLDVAWSLATEEQFYVVWPPVERYFKRLVAPALVGMIAVSEIVNFGWVDGPLSAIGLERGELQILQITFAPICLGVALAHALHHKTSFDRIAKLLGVSPRSLSEDSERRTGRWTSLILAGAIWLVASVEDVAGLPRLVIHLLMTAFLAHCVIQPNHVLRAALTLPLVKRLGMISYGMYLYHMFARAAATTVLEKISLAFPGALFLSCMLLTAFVAELSYRFYEAPLLKLRPRRPPVPST